MEDQKTNVKTIDDYKKDYVDYTSRASVINRSLALGGIAVIWIFRTTTKEGMSIPSELITPLIWLVIALGLDLLQYIIGGLIWWVFYKVKEKQIEKQLINAEDDLKAHPILPNIIHLFYWCKLVSTIIAYCLLLTFLYSEFIKH